MKGTLYLILRRMATCRRRGRLLVGSRRGSVPPIGVGPAAEEGARPIGEGGASNLSIIESPGGSTYHTTVPWGGGTGAGRPRPGEVGPSRREPIRRRREGAGAGSPRATQTHGPRRTLKPRCLSAFRCEGRAASSPAGHPRLRGPDRPLPLLRGGSAATVAGKRAPLFPALLSRATRFSSFSVNNS